jgi:hypothetical protein
MDVREAGTPKVQTFLYTIVAAVSPQKDEEREEHDEE